MEEDDGRDVNKGTKKTAAKQNEQRRTGVNHRIYQGGMSTKTQRKYSMLALITVFAMWNLEKELHG
jgi:hypothetical protein